jgi:hypothetical protein
VRAKLGEAAIGKGRALGAGPGSGEDSGKAQPKKG